ncbi:N5-methyltetrahydromethanopterin:coenzyme M methyltransferase subunit D [Methanomethylovorans hollandica DSM 15978]|uniref:Tetrahydromethanopterin S-methyltransferase subunit D n=1 Tax=Methanomethylovorans hollandica (strain DSM 15978 / NBRC 107637 / DMS1) TaxID=867904 RepID=L0KYT1_METHD|nr:tetrahydromethanopterin S-methyltransferase subunit D [Methanomethylovorans hollandica]AGB50261.1 N5-methyltetrahydromethanopterin:coenzyme M methyltransferase subunit D [Methanomethylovorans hollandica DSM 15978]
MIDIVGLIADNIMYMLLITLGGVLVSVSVHFVPVGGAPAAMAQATGIGTGTVQLAAGAGLTGLVTAGSMMGVTDNIGLVLASGAVGGMIMIAVTMIVGQWVYFYGVGCPAASAKVKYDPITKDRQDLYISQGTEGHAIPTVSFVSGVIGAGLGGLGGGTVYYALLKMGEVAAGLTIKDIMSATGHQLVGLASIFAVGIFFMNAVIPSYNIGGTIEGFHDPKFKKWPKAAITSLVVTLLCAVLAVVTIGGM